MALGCCCDFSRENDLLRMTGYLRKRPYGIWPVDREGAKVDAFDHTHKEIFRTLSAVFIPLYDPPQEARAKLGEDLDTKTTSTAP